MLARYILWPSVCLLQVGVLLKQLHTVSRKQNHTIIGADFRFEVPGQSSVGLTGGGRGQWLGGGTMASAEHKPIMEVWGQSPQWGPGAEPLVRGAKPPEAESILVIGCQTEPANLAPLVKFSK